MQTYQDCVRIEADSMAGLASWLELQSDSGRFVIHPYDKPQLQSLLGDGCYQSGSSLVTVEWKTERKHTGNLFLETWSDFPRKPGWLHTSRADLLCCYFRDVATMYCLPMAKLQGWAFDGDKPAIFAYPEVPQRTTKQRNRTFGRIVPLAAIHRHVGYRSWSLDHDEWRES